MSFIKNIQNLFGFGYPDEEEYSVEDTEQKVDSQAKVKQSTPVHEIDINAPIKVADDKVLMIFEKVVEVTNASVPAYLQSSLNVDKQKRYLYECLDDSLKQYIAQLEKVADEKCKALWQNERNLLKKEMDTVKQRARDLEAKRTEINEQKLSAERQKRALTERVHDLEGKLLQLEADKEQLEIENRGLINKAKVANVYENDIEEMRKQIEEFKRGNDSKAIVEENNNLKAEIERLHAEIAKLNEAGEAAKVKDEMGEAMFKDLQKRAADAQQAVKTAEEKSKDIIKQLDIKDARIADLQAKIDEQDAKLEEDEEIIDQIQYLAEQIDKFDGIKNKLENKVLELKDELKAAQRDNDTLRTTIKNNIYAHAEQEKRLMDEITRLKSQP